MARSPESCCGQVCQCFCLDDWTLKLVMQWTSASSYLVAGIQPLPVEGIENHVTKLNHFNIGNDGGEEIRRLLRLVLSG
jgi:hypothetical protein